MASDTANQIAAWLNAGRDAYLAVDTAFNYGGQRTSPADLAAANAQLSRLNGSGPVDPSDAVTSAQRQTGPLAAINGALGGNVSPYALGIGLGLGALLFLLFRRAR